ncbi:MAG: hypothetical protein LKJ69_12965 [Lactobacillus sp.]|jgi:hypothetical protein|nr:hypothetical protein [Lactobacillus sp.]MCI2034272.1 hypothetical protein [Lactobacillus sp.]
MSAKKLLFGASCFVQAAAFPLLYTWGRHTWSWQLGYALAMTLALSLVRTHWHASWWLAFGTGFGLLASIGQWRLLPLIIAQVGLAFLLNTQTLSPRWQLSLWFIQVYFNQALLLFILMRLLTPTSLLVLALLNLPLILAVWSDHLPLWVDILGLLILIAIGYWTQQLTLVAAGGLLLIPSVISPRFMPLRPLVYVWASILITALFTLTRLHG